MSEALQPTSSAGPVARSVARNATSVFVGRLIASLSIWAALIILAKLSNPVTVGIYAFAQAICIPIAEIAKMGLREVRSSDVAEDYATADYFNLRLIAAGVAFLAMLAMGGLQGDTSLVIIVVALYAVSRVAELMSDVVYAHFQLVERMDHIGRSLCITGPLSLLALSLGYYMTESLIVAVLGQVAAHLLVLALHDLPISRRISAERGEGGQKLWNMPKLKRLAVYALPMTFGTALIMVGVYLPRLTVGNELGLAALGIFGPILALAMAPDRLINSICIALSVRLARYYADRRLDIVYLRLAQVVGILLVLGLPCIWICYAYGDVILRFIYTDAHAEHVTLLVMVATAGLVRVIANTLGFGLIAARRFWWFTYQNAVVAAVALFCCFFVIGRYGLDGAGWTMLAIFGTQLALVVIGLFTLRNPSPDSEASS